MFILVVQKDAMVADLWNCFRKEEGWSPTFLRSFNDCEMEEMEIFLSSIHRKKIKPWIKDKLLLKGSSNGKFSIRTMYRGLDLSPKIDFPFRSVWNSVVPSKISFFAWKASWKNMITLDQLKRRGRAVANKCCLCEKEEETIDHLLIHYKIARMLWDLFLTIVGTSWVFLHSVIHTFLARQGVPVGKK